MTGTTTGQPAQALATVHAGLGPVGADERSLAEESRHRARNRRIKVNVARLATFVVVVGGWQLLTAWKVLDPFFFGQPSAIAAKLVDWFEHGTNFGSVWGQVWITMKEALLGFTYGVAGGILFGLALGRSRFLADVLGPYIKVLNAVPRIVLGSIFLVWLGLGTASKVALASVLVFFVVFFNAFQGVREVDRNLLANAQVLGASEWQITRHVVLPSALTWIIASLHVAFGFSIIGAIVGEFIGAQEGLGVVIASAQNNFDPNGVFAAMIIIGAIALSAEGLISLLEHRVLAWRPRSQTEARGL